ncbi:MAG TPA: UvrB/UvrC motif-containing protein [Fimbriiglobus sp.]|jgi:protein arginine kinase activator
MDCQLCGEPATVHLTDIVNKKKRQMHLCEGCARKQNLITDDPAPQLNLQPLLQLIMGQMGLLPVDTGGLLCPTCGLKYAQFRATGRLGCPDDYDAFRPALEPLLERIHRGLRHAGKVPVAERAKAAAAHLAGLKDDLAVAVSDERYEDAARIRDRIRKMEVAE